jgi:hypothetical protein
MIQSFSESGTCATVWTAGFCSVSAEDTPFGVAVIQKSSSVSPLLNIPHMGYNNNYIRSSLALQPFIGPWPLLQFRNHFYTDGGTPWMGEQPFSGR